MWENKRVYNWNFSRHGRNKGQTNGNWRIKFHPNEGNERNSELILLVSREDGSTTEDSLVSDWKCKTLHTGLTLKIQKRSQWDFFK